MSVRSSEGRSLLRGDGDTGLDHVTFVELFFDLVFVFALTQLSAHLAAKPTFLGGLEGAVLILALWWTWMHTTWTTNWLDPARLPVRSAVLVLAALAFGLSLAITEAFGSGAWLFAICYVVMQLGRSAFMVLAIRRSRRELSTSFLRVLVWLAVSSVLWLVGAAVPGVAQLVIWTAAVLIEYLGAAIGFPVAGLGRSTSENWEVSGSHIAERVALFVIIAIGEGLLATGLEFVQHEVRPAAIVTVVLAIVSSAAAWWIYFDHGEREASEALQASDSPGALGHAAYSYIHLAIIGGVVLLSVGDKKLLAHPWERDPAVTVILLVGPMLFLVGTVLYRWTITHRWMPTHVIGILCLALGFLVALVAPPLVLGLYATGVLAAVAVAETVVRLREGRRSGG